MIEQIKTFEGNSLAFEVIDGFTETDEKLAQKFFNEKLEKGFEKINVLVKLDRLKISESSIKACFEDLAFLMGNYKKIGNLAIVGDSALLKTLVPIDNFFFELLSPESEEKYFEISQMNEALEFITGK